MRNEIGRCRRTRLALLAVLCVACGGDDSPVGPDAWVVTALSPTTIDATVGTAVESPTVLVTDAAGTPLPGVEVRFRATAGEVAPRAVTDARGIAGVSAWVLPTRAGPQQLMVVAGGSSVSFFATARPGAPARLRGVEFLDQVALAGEVVRLGAFSVRDRFENAVADVDVVLEVVDGDGRLGGVTRSVRRPDQLGAVDAVEWTLGARAGTNAVTVRVAGVEPLTFTARTVDPSTVVWYELTSKRQGTFEWAARTADEVTETRIGLTPFDPCVCREQSGHFIERGSMGQYYGTISFDGSGSFRIAADDPVEPITLSWISGIGPFTEGGASRSARARLEGDRLLLERGDPEWLTPQLWIYSRSATPSAPRP